MQTHQGVGTPWGDVHRLVFSDGAQYPCSGPPGVTVCLQALETATKSHLRSDPVKTVVVGVSRPKFVVKALGGKFYLHGVPQRVAGQGEYVRVQGRHALPHVFHFTEFTKLMRTVRVGVSVLRVRLMPTGHAVTIALAKIRGVCEWFGLVRPPPTRTMDVVDLPLVSTLRLVGDMELCPVRL